jgi:MoaA/NifB/PqqE/SkfB family radical SAM enzyme
MINIMQKFRVLRNLIQKRPILVIFDVTKRCNQRCSMCNIWKKGDSKNEMDLSEIDSSLRKLKKFGVGYAFVQGGDPLMRQDIKKIVLLCLKHSIKPTIITNGIALNHSMLSFFSNLPCNLSISLDTLDRKVYKKIRGVDCMDLVLKNIDLASRYKRKGNWSMTSTVTQINYGEIEKLHKFAESKGFMYAIRPYIYTLNKAGRTDDVLVYKNKKEIIGVFKRMYKKTRKTNFLASLVYKAHIGYLKHGAVGRCDAMERSFLLQENGSFSPCVEYPDIIFNKKDQSLEKNFIRKKRKMEKMICKCCVESPCFYNDAREIGVIWRSKFKVLSHLPTVLKNLIKYGNFF